MIALGPHVANTLLAAKEKGHASSNTKGKEE